MSRILNVSSSAVAETIKRYDETGSHEDRHRKGRPRVTSAAEDMLFSVTSLRNCSPNNCFSDTSQVTDTSKHHLFRGDWVKQAFMVKLLQRNHLLGPRNTNNGH
jgi:transposase